MTRVPTPQLGRRDVVAGLAGLTAAALLPGGLAMAQARRLATPAQTEGPFYPVEWAGDIDNDLVLVEGQAARALGQVTHVLGRVLDRSGSAVAGAAVEIWQCDSTGHYRHPRDRQAGRDPGFQGRGRTLTAADGGYSFRTIRPVAYPGRTPHIHFAIAAPQGPRLITQMYVAGEPLNARDGVLNQIRDARQRESVIVRLEPAERLEAGALAGTFDIVLG
jgi:protocatechuate 3,4-dioxygenase, beta subunit